MYYLTTDWHDQISYIKYYTNGTLIKISFYEYDEIGNVLSISGSNEIFTWDGRRLKTHTIGSTTYSYIYNDQGIRTQKSNGTITTEYIVDDNQVLAEKTGSNVIYYTYK